jgi:membrane-bound ClpP family serine protease
MMADSLGSAAAAGIDWESLWFALGLLALAITLLVLEIFVISFGILFFASFASASAAIYYAFAASDAAGWTFAVATPILAAALARWGLARIRTSRHLVAQSEITAEAGYHHVTDDVGARPGAIGVMVTPARPTGRARFDGGECDVQVQGGTAERHARVVVRRVDGPIVFVAPAPTDEASGGPNGGPLDNER